MKAEDPRADGETVTTPGVVEREVLELVASGDRRGALLVCSREHARAIGRLCMALTGAQAEADDLLQETLLAAHDALPTFRSDGSLRSWLAAIARRKCARHLERRSKREARLRLVHDSERQPATDELLVARQRAERARRALDEVRPTEREALLLRFEHDLSFREVAFAIGIDEAAARKRVSRALGRLRAALGEE